MVLRHSRPEHAIDSFRGAPSQAAWRAVDKGNRRERFGPARRQHDGAAVLREVTYSNESTPSRRWDAFRRKATSQSQSTPYLVL
jgi:hypothetical protein